MSNPNTMHTDGVDFTARDEATGLTEFDELVLETLGELLAQDEAEEE